MSKQDTKLGDTQGDQGGEGNYDATRRYREGLEQSVREGRADELAKKAKEAVTGPESSELEQAEEKAKKGEIPDTKR
jgi:hypothetical protein